MFSSQNYIEKPLKLITFDSLGHAIMSQDSIQFLQSVPKPISIISISGPYRTGKSFLLNTFVSGQEKFEVGGTTRSCTKGLWVWGKPLTSLDEKGNITNVLLIDTQGFGSCHQEYDKRIIILALLLSTCFIYNSKGVIDLDSIKDLKYVIEETKKAKDSLTFETKIDFHWILRDFHFKLTNELGCEISSTQYMQKTLKQMSDSKENDILKLLDQFFRDRFCHTITSPILDENGCYINENPIFQQQILRLKKLFNKIPSMDLNGQTLLQIIESFVFAMNSQGKAELVKEGNDCLLRVKYLKMVQLELQSMRDYQTSQQKQSKLMKIFEQAQQVTNNLMSDNQKKRLKLQIDSLIQNFTKQQQLQKQRVQRSKSLKPMDKTRQFTPQIALRQKITLNQETIGNSININVNKNEIVVQLQKVREELEGKVHRYELELEEIRFELERNTQKTKKIQLDLFKQKQSAIELKDELIKREKEWQIERLQSDEKIELTKKQCFQRVSGYHKQNLLLEQKVKYYEQKLATMQLQQIQSTSQLNSKYKNRIAMLNAEIDEIKKSHQAEIDEVRRLYKRSDGEVDQQQDFNNISYFQQVKDYIIQISKLQEENASLLLWKVQNQNYLNSLLNQNKNLQNLKENKEEILERREKEREELLVQIYAQQQALKDEMINEQQLKLKRQRESNESRIMELEQQLDEIRAENEYNLMNYEVQIKKLQNQYVDLNQSYQIQLQKNRLKDLTIKGLSEELSQKRQSTSRQLADFGETIQILRKQLINEIENSKRQSQMKQKLQQQQEMLRDCLLRQKQASQLSLSQQKAFYDIEISRLENRVANLGNSNRLLKEQAEAVNYLSKDIAKLEQEKKNLQETVKKMKQIKRDEQNVYKRVMQENQKLKTEIKQLATEIDKVRQENCERDQSFYEKENDNQSRYKQVVQKYHEKQKQCYLLKEKIQDIAKDEERKSRQLAYQSEKCKNLKKQVEQVKNSLTTLKLQMEEEQKQKLELEQNESVLKQKLQFMSILHKKDIQKLESQIAKFESDTMGHKEEAKQSVEQAMSLKEKICQLQRTIKVYERSSLIMCQNMDQMRKKYEVNVSRYQQNMKLMKKKIKELQNEKQHIQHDYKTMQKKLQNCQETKRLLEQNYQSDIQLWGSKFETYQKRVKGLIK